MFMGSQYGKASIGIWLMRTIRDHYVRPGVSLVMGGYPKRKEVSNLCTYITYVTLWRLHKVKSRILGGMVTNDQKSHMFVGQWIRHFMTLTWSLCLVWEKEVTTDQMMSYSGLISRDVRGWEHLATLTWCFRYFLGRYVTDYIICPWADISRCEGWGRILLGTLRDDLTWSVVWWLSLHDLQHQTWLAWIYTFYKYGPPLWLGYHYVI